MQCRLAHWPVCFYATPTSFQLAALEDVTIEHLCLNPNSDFVSFMNLNSIAAVSAQKYDGNVIHGTISSKIQLQKTVANQNYMISHIGIYL